VLERDAARRVKQSLFIEQNTAANAHAPIPCRLNFGKAVQPRCEEKPWYNVDPSVVIGVANIALDTNDETIVDLNIVPDKHRASHISAVE